MVAYLVVAIVVMLFANPCQVHVVSFGIGIYLANGQRKISRVPVFLSSSSQAESFTLLNMALCTGLWEISGLTLRQILPPS